MKGLYRITMITIALFVALGADAQVKRVNARTQTPCATRDVIYECDYVDEQPQFPGGEREMINFINSTRKYPYEAYRNNIQGRVVCSFVVNPDGTISHLCVIKGCHELLNEEAMRIIKAMPQWIAGKMGKEKVAVRCILPIAFRL
ncbi:MAG: energy transducer TonB [Muribaculaceae bacterium]